MPHNSPKNQPASPSLFNPFPGLRPFTMQESHLFFGREKQGEAILKQLTRNRFVALIGASGSGKSSLMYCGLVPSLLQGAIPEAGKEWIAIATRPGNNPLQNFSIALSENLFSDKKNENSDPDSIRKKLSENIQQLVPVLNSGGIKGKSLLFIVDQFEEIFRFRESGRNELHQLEAEKYVNILVHAVRQTEIPVYLVLTMRSDFIGDCSQFQELTALINQSNYLIPRMSREDLKLAITGPVKVGGATIHPDLVDSLLKEIGDNPDQLPILQHALMRTWDYWMGYGDPNRPISYPDYEAIGKMEKALSEHANEAFDELDEESKQICESLFKTITEKGTDNRGIRHPTRVEVIATIAKTSPEKIIAIADRFRSKGRSFLAPSADIPLTAQSVIDLSHESIMRIWNRLRAWVEEESSAVQMYQRLSDAATDYQEGKGVLWRPPDLQLALSWREKKQPNLTWAQRYNSAFERTLVFLETSDLEFRKEEEHKIRLQKRQLRRTRTFAMVLGSAAIISLGLTVYSQMLRADAIKQKNIADQQRALADSNAVVAQQQTKIAKDALTEAQLQRVKAEENFLTAEQQRRLAERRTQEALDAQKLANDNLIEAKRQEKLALENAEEANRQSKIADKNSQEAYRRRMLSISQSMAVKSLQIDLDKDLKGLVSLQSYEFNKKYEGPVHHPDIYNGLYEAVKLLNKPGFNVFKGHQDAIQSLVFVPGKNIAYSTGADGRILQWNLLDTSRRFTEMANNLAINEHLAISQDGNWLACAIDGKGIQLFNLKSDPPVSQIMPAHNGRIRSLAISPDNKSLFTSGMDNTLSQWSIPDLKKGKTLAGTNRINRIALHPEKPLLAAVTREGEVIFWKFDGNSDPQVIFKESGNAVFCATFSPDGKYLATGDVQGNIRIWESDSGKLIATLRGHSARVQDLAYSPDNQVLGSVGFDGSVRLWDLADLNNPPVVLRDNGGFVMAIAFSPDSKLFITGSTEENRLILRPTYAQDMASEICDRISRPMTVAEWRTYVGSDIEFENTCKSDINIGVK